MLITGSTLADRWSMTASVASQLSVNELNNSDLSDGFVSLDVPYCLETLAAFQN